MLPEGVSKKPSMDASATGAGRVAGFEYVQAIETKRVPFQRQVRDLVPPVGKQCASPGRSTNCVSRMPVPTASRSAPLFRSMTSCQVAPDRRKTTQPAVLPQLGIASDATIAWLPGPAKAPQSTCATGSETSGSSALPRCSRSTTRTASCLEQGPELGADRGVAANSDEPRASAPRPVAAETRKARTRPRASLPRACSARPRRRVFRTARVRTRPHPLNPLSPLRIVPTRTSERNRSHVSPTSAGFASCATRPRLASGRAVLALRGRRRVARDAGRGGAGDRGLLPSHGGRAGRADAAAPLHRRGRLFRRDGRRRPRPRRRRAEELPPRRGPDRVRRLPVRPRGRRARRADRRRQAGTGADGRRERGRGEAPRPARGREPRVDRCRLAGGVAARSDPRRGAVDRARRRLQPLARAGRGVRGGQRRRRRGIPVGGRRLRRRGHRDILQGPGAARRLAVRRRARLRDRGQRSRARASSTRR